jgi:cytochrome b
MPEERRLVWDLPLRLFHWVLVLCLVSSYVTAQFAFEGGPAEWAQVHFWLGYTTIGLLIFRLIWGIVGPRHARFTSFLSHPISVWRYLRGKAPSSVGHNPAGGIMVLVMLVLVAVQATTGLFSSDDVLWSGPYKPAVSGALSSKLTTWHHINFNLIEAAVVVHLGAIAFYALVKKQNLVLPMLTGHKPGDIVPPHEAITSSQLIKALLVAGLAAGAVYFLISHAPPESSDLY